MDVCVHPILLQGPHICWGSEGVLHGHEENDIKGYDNFGTFVEACKKEGLLSGPGPYTVFAPVDSACEGVTFTKEQLEYHIAEGEVSYSAIADMKTLNGNTLSYR